MDLTGHSVPDMPILNMDLDNYLRWRDGKLGQYLTNPDQCLVEISNPHKLSSPEHKKIWQIISSNNFAIYQYHPDNPDNFDGYRSICRQLGLDNRIPGTEGFAATVATIEAANSTTTECEGRAHYIPYTNSKLNWHTDGYYNQDDKCVRSFILHCERAAIKGGQNHLLDHEIVYILLRDKDPELVSSLCHPGCFSIPENVQNNKTIRHRFTGPVFSTDPVTGHLYTRYTQRKHHVSWQQDPITTDALASIREILGKDNHWIVKTGLKPGQGLICNNILHRRDAFDDCNVGNNRRKLYRIRFGERIDPPSH